MTGPGREMFITLMTTVSHSISAHFTIEGGAMVDSRGLELKGPCLDHLSFREGALSYSPLVYSQLLRTSFHLWQEIDPHLSKTFLHADLVQLAK